MSINDKFDIPKSDTWTEWSRYVLKELERNNEAIESSREALQELKVQMATLQTKVYIIGTVLGVLGGAIGTALAKAIVGG